jgi:hypothetical protein
MRCKKNGYFFTEYEAAAVYAGDMFECSTCQAQVIVGVGREPCAEAHEPNFDAYQRVSKLELVR